jgi:hypothetical protein
LPGGETSTSSIFNGLFAFQATAALHLMTCYNNKTKLSIIKNENYHTPSVEDVLELMILIKI